MCKIKKIIVLLLFPLAILMFACSTALIFSPNSQQNNHLQNKYLLNDCGGYVALYNKNSEKPMRIYPEILTNLLPLDTASSIKNGIPIHNEQQLQQIINSLSAY